MRDDLNALYSFSRLFIPYYIAPEPSDSQDQIQDQDQDQDQDNATMAPETDEVYIHLYACMFHRNVLDFNSLVYVFDTTIEMIYEDSNI
jgi:hypothetical protein